MPNSSVQVLLLSAKAAEDDAVDSAMMNVENVLFHRSKGDMFNPTQPTAVWKMSKSTHPANVAAKNFPPAAREARLLDAMMLKRLPNTKTGTRRLMKDMIPSTIKPSCSASLATICVSLLINNIVTPTMMPTNMICKVLPRENGVNKLPGTMSSTMRYSWEN